MCDLNFDDMEVSTKTIIGVSNVELDIQGIYDRIPITEYIVIPRRRGSTKKRARARSE